MDSEQLAQLIISNPDTSLNQIARDNGISRSRVQRAALRVNDARLRSSSTPQCDVSTERRIEKNMKEDSGTVTTRSRDIRTLEDALNEAEVDLSVWSVKRHIVNSWEVTMGGTSTGTGKPETYTNFQVKVFLERRAVNPIEEALSRLTRAVKSRKNPINIRLKKVKRTSKHMAFIGLYDHHFGKLAWEPETGEHYDLKIAEASYVSAAKDLIDKAGDFGLSKICLPLGQDFFHLNNSNNTTAAGTPQDVDGRLPKVYEKGFRAFLKVVELCAEVAPVEVIWVPGNHDPETSYFLSLTVSAWFKDCRRITVDTGPASRKYRVHGVNLIGLTHGNEEPHRDLPTIMAGEVPEMWASTKCREWLVGHLHKAKETRFSAGDTYGAVGVRILPSLCGTDSWHYKKGYVKGPRVAEAHLFHENDGHAGFVVSRVSRG